MSKKAKGQHASGKKTKAAKPRIKVVSGEEPPVAQTAPDVEPTPAPEATTPVVAPQETSPVETAPEPKTRKKGGRKEAATPAPEATGAEATPEQKEPKARKKTVRADGTMSGLDAAAKVLEEAGEPLHCKTIVERAISQGLWKTSGKTPEGTIYSAILREILAKGDQARFRKTDRGLFCFAS